MSEHENDGRQAVLEEDMNGSPDASSAACRPAGVRRGHIFGRRSWRKLHLGVDANTGQIVASTLTTHDVDDGSQAGPLLDQVAGPVASFTGDGAYDQDGVYASVAERHPEAAVVVPPRATAVPSETAESEPTLRDRHLQHIADHGRMARQRASGYTKRARAEAAIGRYKARDRRPVARTYGGASGDRGGRGRLRAQPHAGTGAPEVRPRRLTPDGVGVSAAPPMIRAPCCLAPLKTCSIACSDPGAGGPTCRGGASGHRFWLRDHVLQRMLPGHDAQP